VVGARAEADAEITDADSEVDKADLTEEDGEISIDAAGAGVNVERGDANSAGAKDEELVIEIEVDIAAQPL
jgi:hypothetical protein